MDNKFIETEKDVVNVKKDIPVLYIRGTPLEYEGGGGLEVFGNKYFCGKNG